MPDIFGNPTLAELLLSRSRQKKPVKKPAKPFADTVRENAPGNQLREGLKEATKKKPAKPTEGQKNLQALRGGKSIAQTQAEKPGQFNYEMQRARKVFGTKEGTAEDSQIFSYLWTFRKEDGSVAGSDINRVYKTVKAARNGDRLAASDIETTVNAYRAKAKARENYQSGRTKLPFTEQAFREAQRTQGPVKLGDGRVIGFDEAQAIYSQVTGQEPKAVPIYSEEQQALDARGNPNGFQGKSIQQQGKDLQAARGDISGSVSKIIGLGGGNPVTDFLGGVVADTVFSPLDLGRAIADESLSGGERVMVGIQALANMIPALGDVPVKLGIEGAAKLLGLAKAGARDAGSFAKIGKLLAEAGVPNPTDAAVTLAKAGSDGKLSFLESLPDDVLRAGGAEPPTNAAKVGQTPFTVDPGAKAGRLQSEAGGAVIGTLIKRASSIAKAAKVADLTTAEGFAKVVGAMKDEGIDDAYKVAKQLKEAADAGKLDETIAAIEKAPEELGGYPVTGTDARGKPIVRVPAEGNGVGRVADAIESVSPAQGGNRAQAAGSGQPGAKNAQASAGESHYIFVERAGKRVPVAGPFPSEEAARAAQAETRARIRNVDQFTDFDPIVLGKTSDPATIQAYDSWLKDAGPKIDAMQPSQAGRVSSYSYSGDVGVDVPEPPRATKRLGEMSQGERDAFREAVRKYERESASPEKILTPEQFSQFRLSQSGKLSDEAEDAFYRSLSKAQRAAIYGEGLSDLHYSLEDLDDFSRKVNAIESAETAQEVGYWLGHHLPDLERQPDIAAVAIRKIQELGANPQDVLDVATLRAVIRYGEESGVMLNRSAEDVAAAARRGAASANLQDPEDFVATVRQLTAEGIENPHGVAKQMRDASRLETKTAANKKPPFSPRELEGYDATEAKGINIENFDSYEAFKQSKPGRQGFTKPQISRISTALQNGFEKYMTGVIKNPGQKLPDGKDIVVKMPGSEYRFKVEAAPEVFQKLTGENIRFKVDGKEFEIVKRGSKYLPAEVGGLSAGEVQFRTTTGQRYKGAVLPDRPNFGGRTLIASEKGDAVFDYATGQRLSPLSGYTDLNDIADRMADTIAKNPDVKIGDAPAINKGKTSKPYNWTPESRKPLLAADEGLSQLGNKAPATRAEIATVKAEAKQSASEAVAVIKKDGPTKASKALPFDAMYSAKSSGEKMADNALDETLRAKIDAGVVELNSGINPLNAVKNADDLAYTTPSGGAFDPGQRPPGDYNVLHNFTAPLSIVDGQGRTMVPGSYERVGGYLGKQASQTIRQTERAITENRVKWLRRVEGIGLNLKEALKQKGQGVWTSRAARDQFVSNFVDLVEKDFTDPVRIKAATGDSPTAKAIREHDKITEEMREYIIDSRRKLGYKTPDDWGITDKGYFRHLFLGDISVVVDGQVYGRAKTYAEAQKLAVDAHKAHPSAQVKAVARNNAAVVDPVLRISTRKYYKVVGNIAETVEVPLKEIMDDLRGEIGTKANRQKFLGALLPRKGTPGYSKAYQAVMQTHVLQVTKTQELSKMNKAIQPIVERMRADGLPGLAEAVEKHVEDIWGTPSELEKGFGRMVASMPVLRNHVAAPSFALRSLSGRLTGLQYLLRLKYNLRGSLVNAVQPFSTLWPYVSTKDFAAIYAESFKPSVGKELRDLGVLSSTTKLETAGISAGAGVKDVFTLASERNRAVGYLYGRKEALRRGMSAKEAHETGLAWAERVEFDNSVWNVQPVLRSPVSRVLGQFKSFTGKNLETIFAAAKARPGEPGLKTWGRRGKLGASYLVTGGIKSLGPVTGYLGGFHVANLLYMQLKGAGMEDEEARDVAMSVYYGAPALIGQDLSGSVSIVDFFGDTPAEKVVNFIGGPTVGAAVSMSEPLGKAVEESKRDPKTLTNRHSPRTKDERVGQALTKAAKAASPYVRQGQGAYQYLYETPGKVQIRSGSRNEYTQTLEGWRAWLYMMGFSPVEQSAYWDAKDAGFKKNQKHLGNTSEKK